MNKIEQDRNILIKNEIDSQKTFDKALLTLVAGEIALSITVVTNIVVVNSKCLLFVCWIVLLFSLISQLASFSFSSFAMRKEIECLDNNRKETNYWDRCVGYLNITSFMLFVVGSILFLLFVMNNIVW